jgi:plastocyanin
MTRRIVRLARLLTIPALLAIGMFSTPTVSAGNPCFHGYTMPPTSTGPGSDIKLMPCAFVPTVTVIAEGESVNFVNGPEQTHLVTGAAQEWGSAETEIQPNETLTYTFDEAGVYPYACALHPGMSGAIVVGEPADAVAADGAGSVTSVGSTDQTTDKTTTEAAGGSSDESTAAQAETEVSLGRSNATAEASTTEPTTFGTLALVGLGVGVGIVTGAAVLWLAMRRRQDANRVLARAE